MCSAAQSCARVRGRGAGHGAKPRGGEPDAIARPDGLHTWCVAGDWVAVSTPARRNPSAEGSARARSPHPVMGAAAGARLADPGGATDAPDNCPGTSTG